MEISEGRVWIPVTDTGPGIADGLKSTIFDRFIRDSSTRSSYGPGLHIIRMLAEAYGGKARADDRIQGHPEQGAAIRFPFKKA